MGIYTGSPPSNLLALAGLVPSVYHSCNYQVQHSRMSKRGSRVLRYVLINAVRNVVKNNATFRGILRYQEGRRPDSL
ncbi:transposase [Hungatella sp.]|uniref:transposase n=1 Tax=Hungatella sp. TaxID=2613924 RepID=UPI002A7F9D48|nr:transposase [Hungatella sp.]